MAESSSTEFVTRTEAALRASEALKTAIFETALDCIVTIDHRGRVVDFNPAAERTFGYTREETLGQEMADLIIPPELRQRHRVGLSRAVASGRDTIVGQRIEITAMRKGGEQFPVELAITRISGSGEPIFTGHIRDITERKRADAALQASQQLLASITHNITDGIYRRLASGELAFVNDAFLKMSGYGSLAELHQVGAKEHYVSPQRRSELLELLERDGGFRHEEVECRRADGSTFWGLISAIAIRDPATGTIVYSDGAITDITQRKHAELRRATQLAITRILAEVPTLTDAAPRVVRAVCESLRWDVGTIWRVEGESLSCVDVWPAGNSALAEFEAVTRGSSFARGVGLPGRVWAAGEPQWIADVTLDENFPRASLAKRAGLHGAFAFPVRLGELTLGVVEFFSREIRQPNEEILGMFASLGGEIGQFIERKRAEEAIRELNSDLERRVAIATRGLRESQERFSKAFRSSPVYLSIARLSDGRFVEANEAFLHSSGYTREQVIGRTSAELGLWDQLEQRGGFLLEVQLRGFVRNREVLMRSKDRRLDTVLLSAERIDIDGEPHVLAVGLNITARKRAEEDMRRALEQEKELSRLKTNFVTLVSHEFRTPLGIIMSAADILQQYLERLTPERRQEQLQDIHDASRRMADLMDEMLLLARVEAGRMECNRVPLELGAFCQRVAANVRASGPGAHSIVVTLEKAGSAPALADEALLRHIFTNLLSNAVKYSAAGTPVHFAVERQGTEAVFIVRDQGIGIPAADLSQLFATFHRGANVGQRPGTGVGLVIVKRCVELHGGTIALQSEEGHGTTVTVRLPLFTAPPNAARSKAKASPKPRPTRRPAKAKKGPDGRRPRKPRPA